MSRRLLEPKLKDMLNALDKADESIKLPPVLSCEELAKELTKGVNTQLHNKILKEMFVNFFSGKAVFKNIETFNQNKEFLLADFDEHLTLYKLLCFGWDEICNEFKGVAMPANSPGEALAFILSFKQKDSWERKNNLVNPKAMYLAWHQLQKCKELDKQGLCSEEDKAKLSKLTRRIGIGDKPEKQSEATIFVSLCMTVCNRSKNSVIKNAAQDYQAKVLENQSLTIKQLRTRDFKL